MDTSTRVMGIIGSIILVLGVWTQNWWWFAFGSQLEISALLFAIYEK